MRRENERARAIRPREAGEGDHWSSRSERTVVEGRRTQSFVVVGELSKPRRGDILESFVACRVLRPFHHPASQGGPPSPLLRGRMIINHPLTMFAHFVNQSESRRLRRPTCRASSANANRSCFARAPIRVSSSCRGRRSWNGWRISTPVSSSRRAFLPAT